MEEDGRVEVNTGAKYNYGNEDIIIKNKQNLKIHNIFWFSPSAVVPLLCNILTFELHY